MKEFDKIILGLDPGTNVMGYGIIQINGKAVSMLSMGSIQIKDGDYADKLKRIFDKTLEREEIATLSDNYDIGLTSNYGDYVSSRHIDIYYDSRFMLNYKLIDLSSNRNEGLIYNAYPTKLGGKSKKVFHKPKRRKSKILYLKHEDGGFVGGRWKDDLTRWNQLRFNNEIKQGRWDFVEDGLTSLEFKMHGKRKEGKITYLNVGL